MVKLQKDFIGRDVLQEVKAKGPAKLRVGLIMQNRVIPRHGFNMALRGEKIGEVTSGSLSPILNTGVAMGYTESARAKEGTLVDVHIRDRYEPARITKTPFYDTTKYGYSRKTQ